MILLRAREFGSGEWDLISLEGELEERLQHTIGEELVQRGLHVQVRGRDGLWEDFDA